jgi:hypothetical protein
LSLLIPLLRIRDHKTDPALPQWPPPESGGAFQPALRAALHETTAARILTMLRKITHAPVFLSPAPVSSLQLPALRTRLARRNESERLVRMFEEECHNLAQSGDAGFLPQPLSTRDEDGIATKAAYSQQPARFNTREAAPDKSHMNSEYGAAVLRDFLAAASLPSR